MEAGSEKMIKYIGLDVHKNSKNYPLNWYIFSGSNWVRSNGPLACLRCAAFRNHSAYDQGKSANRWPL